MSRIDMLNEISRLIKKNTRLEKKNKSLEKKNKILEESPKKANKISSLGDEAKNDLEDSTPSVRGREDKYFSDSDDEDGDFNIEFSDDEDFNIKILSRREKMDNRIMKIFKENKASNGKYIKYDKFYSDPILKDLVNDLLDEKSRKAQIRDYILNYGVLEYENDKKTYRVKNYGGKPPTLLYKSNKRGYWSLIN